MQINNWYEQDQTWILMPPHPEAMIHFLGGAFIGIAPYLLYDNLLTTLAKKKVGILAPVYQTDTNHMALANTMVSRLKKMQTQLNCQHLPTFGLGHSLGCKLHILSCIQDPDLASNRKGHIFMAYSNASLQKAVPWGSPLQTLSDFLGSPSWLDPNLWIGEFEPSPQQTIEWIQTRYEVAAHLLIKFQQDPIDDIQDLYAVLQRKFGSTVQLDYLPGDHGTSVGSRYPFPIGSIVTPVDVLGQFIYQTLNQANYQVCERIVTWIQAQVTSSRR